MNFWRNFRRNPNFRNDAAAEAQERHGNRSQLAALALGLLAGPIDDGRPRGNVAPRWRRVGVANSADDMLDVVRATGA